MKTKFLLLSLAASVLVLDSCWFNSAGFLFDKASYKAESRTSDIKVGDKVYKRNGGYYMNLPMYQVGKGPQIMYGLGVDDKREERNNYKGLASCRLGNAYAEYITGLSSVPVAPQIYHDTDSSFSISGTELKVVRTSSGSDTCNFTASSLNKGALITLGVLDVLCVDLPVSAVCTSLTAGALVCGGALAIVGKSVSSSLTTTTTTTAPSATTGWSGGDYQAPQYYTCPRCDGTGRVPMTGAGALDRTFTYGIEKPTRPCSTCNGSGVIYK